MLDPGRARTGCRRLKIALLYVAVVGGPITGDLAARFVATYSQFPPNHDHDTIVICNGGTLPLETRLIFSPLPSVQFFSRANDPGWDISGYIEAARTVAKDYDAVCCCGESVFFTRAGWLARVAEEWAKRGPGFYGFFGSFCVRAHLQTTAFMCPPVWLTRWPNPVNSRAARYDFEHGPRSLWRLMSANGLPALLVTWDGCYPPREWRFPRNIIYRGDQSNCLMMCNHAERYVTADANTRRSWERYANQSFQ